MDFFARQDHARALTRRLIWLFALAVMATVIAVNLLTYVGVEWYLNESGVRGARPLNVEASPGQQVGPWITDLHLKAQLAATLVTLAIIALGSLFKTAQLRGGGPVVAVSLGGRPAQPERDQYEQQLVNVVEEMAIASGVPMPQVYVLDREDGINAFAAGLGQRDAVVAVTRGALHHFTRDELQGVIGHEFSHILNGDMRINLRLMGLIHGILVIALTGRLAMRLAANSGRSRSSNDKGGNAALPILLGGLALLVVGSIGYFFGQLIKAAISRQREFLADASAVQFTRNPEGMASALKKLGAGSSRAAVGHPRTSEASHLFFGTAVAAPFMSLLATHPPLPERIRAIDPRWDGSYPPATEVAALTSTQRSGAPMSSLAGASNLAAGEVVSRIGSVSPEQVAFGAALIESLPEAVLAAARETFSARAVVIALLFGPERAKAVPLMDLLERAGDPGLVREVRRLHPAIAGLATNARLPLLEISCPALQQLSASQRGPFLTLLHQLAQADGVISPMEYCLTRLVALHLAPPSARTSGIYALGPLVGPATVLLSALAHFGHQDDPAQQQAFAAGTARLLRGKIVTALLPVKQCGPAALDGALQRLADASPGLKRQILEACAWTVAADGTVHPLEAELLRVVSMMLGCPMPPFAGA